MTSTFSVGCLASIPATVRVLLIRKHARYLLLVQVQAEHRRGGGDVFVPPERVSVFQISHHVSLRPRCLHWASNRVARLLIDAADAPRHGGLTAAVFHGEHPLGLPGSRAREQLLHVDRAAASAIGANSTPDGGPRKSPVSEGMTPSWTSRSRHFLYLFALASAIDSLSDSLR